MAVSDITKIVGVIKKLVLNIKKLVLNTNKRILYEKNYYHIIAFFVCVFFRTKQVKNIYRLQ